MKKITNVKLQNYKNVKCIIVKTYKSKNVKI